MKKIEKYLHESLFDDDKLNQINNNSESANKSFLANELIDRLFDDLDKQRRDPEYDEKSGTIKFKVSTGLYFTVRSNKIGVIICSVYSIDKFVPYTEFKQYIDEGIIWDGPVTINFGVIQKGFKMSDLPKWTKNVINIDSPFGECKFAGDKADQIALNKFIDVDPSTYGIAFGDKHIFNKTNIFSAWNLAKFKYVCFIDGTHGTDEPRLEKCSNDIMIVCGSAHIFTNPELQEYNILGEKRWAYKVDPEDGIVYNRFTKIFKNNPRLKDLYFSAYGTRQTMTKMYSFAYCHLYKNKDGVVESEIVYNFPDKDAYLKLN